MSTAKKLYTVAEVAEMCSLSKRLVDEYIKRGDLVAVYAGEKFGATRIREADLDAFLAALPTQKPAKAAS